MRWLRSLTGIGTVFIGAGLALAGTTTVSVPVAHGATAAGVTYQAAGTDSSPSGAQGMWHMPSLTSFTGSDGVLRLLRSVNRSTTDGGGAGPDYITQYLELGRGTGWKPVNVYDGSGRLSTDLAQKITMNNVVQAVDPSTHKLTLHAVEAGGYVAADHQYRLADFATTDGINWRLRTSAPLNLSGSAVAQQRDGNGTLVPGGVVPYQGIETLPDGDWLMPIYFNRCVDAAPCITDETSVIGLAASSDQGRSWTKPALPFVSTTYNFSEATVIRRPRDGRLVMIGRYDYSKDKDPDYDQAYLSTLVYRVSTTAVNSIADLTRPGFGWSAPAVHVPGTPQRAGLDYGASPRLVHVGSKIMLVFGRPGDTQAWNTDGTALTWTDVHHVANPDANRPTACNDAATHSPGRGGSVPCAAMGSSGYQGVAVTDAVHGTGYLVGDTCHVWSCEPTGSGDAWPDVSWPSGDYAHQKVWMYRFSA